MTLTTGVAVADLPEPVPYQIVSSPTNTLNRNVTAEPVSRADLLQDVGWAFDPLKLRVNNVGSTTSQADPVLRSDLARSAFGVDGAGITIGVISDSFDALGGAGSGIASGDLPGAGNPFGNLTPVTVVKDDLAASSTDEGRAMIELIHDIAPGANLLFHSAFNTPGTIAQPPDQSIANAIDALVVAGADIIVDDVAFLNEPFFQDGAAAQSVDAAVAAGVTYFSSAGNFGGDAYQNNFDDSGSSLVIGTTDFGALHDFDPSASVDTGFEVTLANGAGFTSVLQWSDPFFTIGGTPESDFDLFVAQGNTIVDLSTRDQASGGDLDGDGQPDFEPWELVSATNNTGATTTFDILISNFASTTNPEDEILKVLFTSGASLTDPVATPTPTIFGHAAAEGAIAVAAQAYFQFTGPNSSVESFTSLGDVTILFDGDGNPIAVVRQKPDLTATDGTNTTFFGFDVEPDGFPNFFGTSAAAPHAAAVAALLLEYAQDTGLDLAPSDVASILSSTAIDLEASGFDNLSGAGLIDAFAALSSIPEPNTLALLTLGGLALSSRRRVA